MGVQIITQHLAVDKMNGINKSRTVEVLHLISFDLLPHPNKTKVLRLFDKKTE